MTGTSKQGINYGWVFKYPIQIIQISAINQPMIYSPLSIVNDLMFTAVVLSGRFPYCGNFR